MVLDRNQKAEVLFTGDYRGVRVYQLRGRVKPHIAKEENEHTVGDVQHTARQTAGSRELRLN